MGNDMKNLSNKIVRYKSIFLTTLMLCLSSVSFAIPIEQVPRPDTQPVIDVANLLSEADENALIKQITQLHNTTGDYIVVVTLPTIKDTDLTPKQYATKLFETWQIGNKDKDNGLLILDVADVRRIEIETGYGLEGALPDSTLKQIQTKQMVPAFKQGDFAKGFQDGVAVIGEKLIAESQANHTSTSTDTTSQKRSFLQTSQNFWGNYLEISVLFFGFFAAGFFYQRALKRFQFQKNTNNTPKAHAFDVDDYAFDTQKTLWREGLSLYLVSWIVGGLVFFFESVELGTLEAFKLGLGVAVVIAIAASLTTLRHPTTWNKYWQNTDLDLPQFYLTTNLNYTTLGIIVRTLFSPFFLLAYMLYRFKQKSLRSQIRQCPQCQHNMVLLAAEQTPTKLSHFYQQEIAQGFAEYDIWICQYCHFHRTFRYQGKTDRPSYQACPNCRQHAYYLVDSKTVEKPTYDTTGLEKLNYECLACGCHNEIEKVIPVKTHSSDSSTSSSSSSSSSSSDSGYSSSDGGSSGGGGSGSDY